MRRSFYSTIWVLVPWSGKDIINLPFKTSFEMTCQKTIVRFLLLVGVFVQIVPQNGSGARILSVSFMSTRSHKITYDPLLKALAARGHNITVVSPVPAKKSIKNLRDILTIDVDEIAARMPNMFELKLKNRPMDPWSLFSRLLENCDDSLNLPQVRALQSENFDLIFVSALTNECALAFAYTFKTPIILISPLSVHSYVSRYYGNPSPPSFVPNLISGYTDKMNLYERTMNLLTDTMWGTIMDFYYVPAIEKIYRKKLGMDLPDMEAIFKSTSMILSNSHFSIAAIRPFLPDIVEVGGMHCRDARPLPKDLEDFVSNSGDDGFILFSMGSLLKASEMPEEKRKLLISVFSKLKQKVIWKWEIEKMEDLPSNVKLSKWLPQQDVLGHPKIRAFITHGGFGSTTESVYHGVPIIGLPMFADQVLNMEIARRKEFGIVLDFNTFTEESLLDAIHKITSDPKYKHNSATISSIFHNQADHPLDRAVFWSEYVIQHKGAPHLRSAARDLNFVQYHSIDVIGLIAATLIILLWIIVKILRLCFTFIFSVLFGKAKQETLPGKKQR